MLDLWTGALMALQGKFDVVFIGGGGASYPGAFELAKRGMRVLLVDDRGLLGGVCTYAGCVPSKALRRWGLAIRDAEVRASVKVDPDEVWRKAIEAKDKVQSEVFKQLGWLAEQLHDNLELVRGWAVVRDGRAVSVKTEDGERTVETRFIHIGAGSVNVIPGIPGKELAMTSDNLYGYLSTPRQLPGSIAIVGAGYVGVETAYVLSMYKVKVTLVEMMSRPLPNMPLDVSRSVLRGLQRMGVEIHLGVKASSIDRRGGAKVLRVIKDDGTALEVEADEVMLAVGRRPRLEGYGLESLASSGLEYTKEGVKVNEYMRTSVPNVYAAGDVTGGAMLYHAAVLGSLVASRNIAAGQDVHRFDLHLIPRVVFTYPEAGYLGYTEDELSRMGIRYGVVRYSMKANSSSLIEGHADSWVKVLVERGTGSVLGVEAYAPEAPSILTAFAISMRGGLRAEDLYWTAAPHPTPMEVVGEAFRLSELLS
ncbi:MAG: dihydrolipoyl dehydrogenase family protein [Acidilobus sp.]